MKKKMLVLIAALAASLLLMASCAPAKDAAAAPNSNQSGEETPPLLGSFTAPDLAGNEVSQTVLADAKLTMVNIWATFCGPCLREMPELGELSGEYRDRDFQIVGIVMDTLDRQGNVSEEQVATAKDIVAKTGADYLHLLPSDDLISAKLKDVTGVPETFFVDKDGRQVGKAYVGAKSKADWAKIIEETLALVPEEASSAE